ncbi:MAG: O-antigen ligase domain-containing protein, partial [Phycisphaeraceae bacterium]|nr:O-antigen ligase domain-containing protein [Phycisphaeraceae bacterium]
MNVSPIVHLAMMGWIAVSLILFLILPTRRAVIAGTIISMLFLPIHEYLFRG